MCEHDPVFARESIYARKWFARLSFVYILIISITQICDTNACYKGDILQLFHLKMRACLVHSE